MIENTLVDKLLQKLATEVSLISEARKEELAQLAKYIEADRKQFGRASLIFVCTHNSRRSQLSEVWWNTIADYLGFTNVPAFSGGTEATAFNPRMVAALERAGFWTERYGESANPKYQITYAENQQDAHLLFSKKYDHSYNPQKDFIAIMVCTQADEGCPVVSGATHRMVLSYKDPKAFDDTPRESIAYSEKVLEIGRELLYLGKMVASKN